MKTPQKPNKTSEKIENVIHTILKYGWIKHNYIKYRSPKDRLEYSVSNSVELIRLIKETPKLRITGCCVQGAAIMYDKRYIEHSGKWIKFNDDPNTTLVDLICELRRNQLHFAAQGD